MSRFGSTATFLYQTGDSITAGTPVYLTAGNMPNYPFEEFEDSDRQIHVTKSGRKYIYQNYGLKGYTFSFSNLSETTLVALKQMFDARPIFTFNTNSTIWGTFRFAEDTWKDSEIAHELYDLNFSIVEDA
jgi:hypothetical protein